MSTGEKLEVEVRAHIDSSMERDLKKAAQGFEQFGKSAEGAGLKVDAQAKKMEDLKRASTEVGRGMLVAGAAIGAGVFFAVQAFANFDKSLSGFKAVSGATKAETDALTDTAMRLGEQFGKSASEVVDAATALNKAGVSTADILGGALQGALNLAATDTIALADAAEAASIAMVQFGLAGEDVPHLADLLAAGAGEAVGNVSDLTLGMKQSGLVAGQFGLSVEETVGTLSAFAAAGLVGSDAGTSFKTMLLALASPSGVAAKKMAELGLSAYDAQGNFIGIEALAGELQRTMGGLSQESRNAAMSIIFGQDAIRASTELYKLGAAGVDEWTKKVDQTGYASRVAAEKLNNLTGDWQKLVVSIENGLIESGSSADGFLRPVIQQVTGVVQAFRDLPESAKGAVLAFAATSSGALLLAGAVLTIAPKLLEAKQAYDKLTAASPGFTGGLSKAAKAAEIAGAAFAGLLIAGRVGNHLAGTGRSFEEMAQQILKASNAGDKFSATFDADFLKHASGNLLGEMKVGNLQDLFKASDQDDFNGFMNNAVKGLTGYEAQVHRATNALSQADKVLANMATSGNTKAAADGFSQFAKASGDAGLSQEKLFARFPEYINSLRAQATQMKVNLSDEELYQWAIGNAPAKITAYTNSITGKSQAEAASAAATEKFSEALAEIGVSASGAIENLSAFTDWLISAGLMTLSTRDATAQYEEAIDGLGQKTADIMATHVQLGGVLNETATDFDLTSEAGRAGNAVFAELAQKGLASAAAFAKNGESQEVVQGQLVKTYNNMVTAAQGFGLSEDAAVALTREVLKVPPGVDVKSWMSEQARIEAEKTKAAMDAIDGRVVKTYTQNLVENINRQITQQRTESDPSMTAFEPGTFAPGKAAGGAIYGDGPKGVDKDLYRLAKGEHVLTSDEVDRMGGQAAVYAMRAAIRSGVARPAAAPAAAAPAAGPAQGVNVEQIVIQQVDDTIGTSHAVTRRLSSLMS
ncbi:phage tail tape measure protein [Pseudarthrobacter oxydans]|uniref:phage tail tape measure protein n=1 Tax=Pseudarthrobacter oxydans TaxID=1671 RepID=UPI003420070C